MTDFRVETDSFGELHVSSEKYWGAQTQRSLINFPIGWEKQPESIVKALGIIKMAEAKVNMKQNKLDPKIGNLITAAANEVNIMNTSHYPYGKPAPEPKAI